MKRKVIFSDRDGTINKDDNYYLGSSNEWRVQVKILESVVDGIQLLNGIEDSYFFILTNQSGVALKGGEFDNLTEERMREVNMHIIDKLNDQGCRVDDLFACPYVDYEYMWKAKEKGLELNMDYVQSNCRDMKPNIGMMEKALESVGLSFEECEIYMIGDRTSDVEMGLLVGGTGILIESSKTREMRDSQKVADMDGEAYIASNFLDAARIIYRAENN